MKWLRYHHKFSSGGRDLQWQPIADSIAADKDELDEVLSRLSEMYSGGEHYRGIDYDVLDEAPRWVIEQVLKRFQEQFLDAERQVKIYDELLATARDCRQCGGARAPTVEERRDAPLGYAGRDVIDDCPLCGRTVLVATMLWQVMPDDARALARLRRLAARPWRLPTKLSAPEAAAVDRLMERRLIARTRANASQTLLITERGRAELLKHQQAVESAKS